MEVGFGAREAVVLFVRVVAVTAAGIFMVKKICDYIDPSYDRNKKSKIVAEQILKSIGVKNVAELTKHELVIATHVISTDTGVSWSDVGGYAAEISEMQDNIILPLKFSNSSTNFSAPKGVLLYGPPGCGKTLIAKALAKASGARFINLQVSTLTEKWYGESEKLAAAVFSLAHKLQPSIIFMDEIDSFLRARNTHDHEVTAMMKALFLSLWDGFATDRTNKIIFLGATNRPQDIDPAILRRMPSKYYIGLPDAMQRDLILQVILRNENLDGAVDIEKLATLTDSFSGSDLMEVARLASVYAAKDSLLTSEMQDQPADFRPLTQADFEKAVAKCMQNKDTTFSQSFFSPLFHG